jgi:hypothetical protein
MAQVVERLPSSCSGARPPLPFPPRMFVFIFISPGGGGGTAM